MQPPALMFVELPTLDGDISIEASKIIGIRQDKQSHRHAWIDTGREYAYSITFPADHEFVYEDARREILWIMHSSLMRAIMGNEVDLDVDLRGDDEPPLPTYPYHEHPLNRQDRESGYPGPR